ncbi:hypothetical protein I307_05324 [Cryptococcus deuterogattii 99/473]|uniref:Uncharacterized protein n=1 Tax=Cryptococcus deuterogattii Ram5 TaxID=1296110 RepID=A0A0D0T4Y0_9TREE|nr:hypothetical protein I313_02858 [Cryptococcus deuterogattii Ram5]KIY55307.1 hypothetical protein I307_05324 [Cryptococcus deuterogattii 99/473]
MPSITLLPFLNTVPPATRALTALYLLTTLTVLLLAFLAPPADWPWLLLVPGHSWKYPWVLLTAAFAELSVVNSCPPSHSLSPAGTSNGYGAPVNSSASAASPSSGQISLPLASAGSYGLFLDQKMHSFTQLIPEHQVQLLGKVKLRVKSLPGIHLLISNILVILLGPSPFILIQFGFFVAWVYLRFFKPSPDGGLYRGDRSETFAFQYWFPPVVRPYISVVANHVYTLATRVHLVQAWDESANEYSLLPGPGGLTSASGSNAGLGAGVGVVGGAGGGARAEAERRRALALKALDARLASTPSPAPAAPAAPTLAAAAAPDPATPTLLAAAAAETTGTENGSPTKDTPAAADVESTAIPGIPSTSPSKPKPKPSSTTAPTQAAQPTQPTQTAPAQTQATQAQTQGQGKGQGKKGKGKGKDKKPPSPVQAEDKAEKVDKEEKEEKKKEE